MNPGALAGEHVLVTGAAQGIGRAIAQQAARQGAAVTLLDVAAHGDEVASQLRKAGSQALFLQADITQLHAIKESVSTCRGQFGPVTILVNNAGRNAYFNATTMTETDWDDVFSVDLKAAWLMARTTLPDMIQARRGSIVNLSSIHAAQTIDGMFPYAAAKAGVLGLTRSLALDVAKYNIRVNAVSPGFVRTRLVEEWLATGSDPAGQEERVLRTHPLGRIGTPEEIAQVVCFLASAAASFVTGADWVADGGLSAKFA